MACPFCHRVMHGDVTEAKAPAVAFADAYPWRRATRSWYRGATWRACSIWRALRRIPGGRCVAGTAALAGRTARTAPGFAPASPLLAPSGLEGQSAPVWRRWWRRAGDVLDPRGGVRWVLPEQAGYWNSSR